MPLAPFSPRRIRTLRRILAWGAAILGALALILAGLAYIPVGEKPLAYHPLPHLTYAQTVAAVRERIRMVSPEIRGECRGMMLEHGRVTERAFVLMHGLSNCPAQFRRFGELLYRRGYNVVILRLPFHGERNKLTRDWERLTAQMMLDAANNAVDVAGHLGKRVTVIGLSVNAVVGAWLAQNRADLDEVALFAPFLAPKWFRSPQVGPMGRLILRLPNRFLWWDEQKKANLGGTAYPRYPSHAIGQVMRISAEVLDQAALAPPECARILLVTTACDEAANAHLTDLLMTRWRRRAPEKLRAYEFPRELNVGHDFIDPTQPYQRIDVVYPKLLSLLGANASSRTSGGTSRIRSSPPHRDPAARAPR
jgi:carboxylesterase